MEEWKEYKAIDFCENVTDGTHDSPKPVDEGHYLITSKHLQKNSIDFSSAYKISETDYLKVIQRSRVVQYDILFSMIGTIGNTVRVISPDIDFAVKNMAIFKMGGDNLKSKWLYYWLQSNTAKEYIYSRLSGSTQSYLTLDSLRNFPVYAPSENKMRMIVELLSSLDDKIDLNNHINHNLEQQAQTLFKSWFVDFEPFKQERFVNTEMGLIPKDWSIVPFFDIVRLCSGGTPKTEQPDYWGGNIPFFTPKDVSISPFCLKTEKYITKSGLDHCNSHLYEPFTTFITARGTVGRLCMAGYPMAMNQTNYAICSISIDPILAFLFSKQIVNNLKNKANGAVFDAITTRDFEGERIIMAPENILSKFSSTIRPLYNQILENEKQSLELAKTRDLVLPALMTGQTINHNC